MFSQLFLLLCAENLLPLTEHVHVHGGKEGDVEQHGDEDEQGEAEAGVEFVGQMYAENVVFVSMEQPCQLA